MSWLSALADSLAQEVMYIYKLYIYVYIKIYISIYIYTCTVPHKQCIPYAHKFLRDVCFASALWVRIFVISFLAYILLFLKILWTVCVGYHCSNHTAAGCAYIQWCVLLLLFWTTLLTLSEVIGMSTLYLCRCAVAAFTSTKKSGQLW